MTFKQFVQMILARTGLELRIYPGPELPYEDSGSCVVLTRTGGPGFAMENMTDAQSWQVRTIGDQNDYDSAETLAFTIDQALAGTQSQTVTDPLAVVDPFRLVLLTRSGSPPSPLLVDDSERHHFVASYTATVPSR